MPAAISVEAVMAMLAIVEATQLWGIHNLATEEHVEKRVNRHLNKHHDTDGENA